MGYRKQGRICALTHVGRDGMADNKRKKQQCNKEAVCTICSVMLSVKKTKPKRSQKVASVQFWKAGEMSKPF